MLAEIESTLPIFRMAIACFRRNIARALFGEGRCLFAIRLPNRGSTSSFLVLLTPTSDWET